MKKTAAKKPPTKKAATRSSPAKKTAEKTKSTKATGGWVDPALKCKVTVTWLLQEKGRRTLKAAIARYVDPDDCYLSEAMEAFLLEYPLGETELAKIASLDEGWTQEVFTELAPAYDFDLPLFDVKRWDDLARLPNLKQLDAQGGDAPSPRVVAREPTLRSLTISTTDKKAMRDLPKLEHEGFFVTELDYGRCLARLTRTHGGPNKAMLDLLSKTFPKQVYRKGKGGFRIHLRRIQVEPRGLVGRLELTVWGPDDEPIVTIGGEHQGEASNVLLLPTNDLAGGEDRLKKRCDELVAYVTAERHLPKG